MIRGLLLAGGASSPPDVVESRTAVMAATLRRTQAPDAAYTLAPGQSWATLKNTIGNALVTAIGNNVNTNADRYGQPLWWPRVNIADGVYTEQFTGIQLGHIVGNINDPAAARFDWPGFKGAWNINGPMVLVEGLTAHSTSGTGPDADGWYGLHLSPSARVTAYHRCHFRAQVGAGVGMDGDPGSIAFFLDCVIRADRTPGMSNLHGGSVSGQPGLSLAFIDCDSDGVSYTDIGTGNPDRVWIQGGTCDAVRLDGAAVIGYLDPDVVDPATVTLANGATAQYVKTLPTIPTGMMRPEDTAWYGTPTTATLPHTLTGTASNGAVTAGRTYYVPISTAAGSKVATAATITATTAAGGLIAGIATDNGGQPGTMFDLGGTNTLTAGTNTVSVGYKAALFPGDVRVWLALTFDSAATVAGVTTSGAYYQDGGLPARGATCTPVALPTGFCPTGTL